MARADPVRTLARLRPEAWLGDRSYLLYRALFFGCIGATLLLVLLVPLSRAQPRPVPASPALDADVARLTAQRSVAATVGPRPRISGIDAYREVVYVTNLGPEPADLTGWMVVSPTVDGRREYRFPFGFVLAPNADVRVHAHDGIDTLTDLYWRLPQAMRVFDARGDMASLIDPTGHELSRYTYARR